MWRVSAGVTEYWIGVSFSERASGKNGAFPRAVEVREKAVDSLEGVWPPVNEGQVRDSENTGGIR